MDNYKEITDKLFNDYLDLCESYNDQLPISEFGFAMIRIVSKMLFDAAPNSKVALDTIQLGVIEGLKWHAVSPGHVEYKDSKEG
jgi:hypothetical protein